MAAPVTAAVGRKGREGEEGEGRGGGGERRKGGEKGSYYAARTFLHLTLQ